MTWITQDGSGAITAIAANAQGAGWTEIADDDARIAAFLNAPPSTIDSASFMLRFPPSARQAIILASQTAAGWQIAFWLHRVAALGSVDVTAPETIADMAGLVAQGFVTTAQSAQILNLAVASP